MAPEVTLTLLQAANVLASADDDAPHTPKEFIVLKRAVRAQASILALPLAPFTRLAGAPRAYRLPWGPDETTPEPNNVGRVRQLRSDTYPDPRFCFSSIAAVGRQPAAGAALASKR